MTNSGFIIKRSFRQIVKNPSASGIIIFALTVCTFAALILSAAIADRYSDLQATLEMKKLYYFDEKITARSENGRYPLFEKLFSEDFPGIDSFLSIEATLPNGKKLSAIYSGKEFDTPKDAEMSQGRSYTAEELKSGESIAVVNVSECEGIEIGGMVKIGGQDFTLIGSTFGDTTVPLYAALKHGWSVSFGDAMFTDFLGEEQEAHLRQIVLDSGGGSVITQFELFGTSTYDTIKRAIIGLAVLLTAAGIIISEVFSYTIASRMHEFGIYIILGVRSTSLFWIYYIPPIIMLAFSLILGGTAFLLSKPVRVLLGIVSGFTPKLALIAVLAIILLMMVTTFPKYIKILRQSPHDTEVVT